MKKRYERPELALDLLEESVLTASSGVLAPSADESEILLGGSELKSKNRQHKTRGRLPAGLMLLVQ